MFKTVLTFALVINFILFFIPRQADPYTFSDREKTPSILSDEYTTIKEEWDIISSYLGRGAYAEALRTLPSLNQRKLELGIRNLFFISEAILFGAEKAEKESSPEIATNLVKEATLLSPDYPQAHFKYAGLQLKYELSSIPSAFIEIFQGISSIKNHLPTLMRIFGNFSFFYLTISFIVFLTFGFTQLIKNFKLISHTFKDILPRGVTTFQGTILLIILFVLPVVFGYGILVIIIFWCLLCFLHQNKREKIVNILLILSLSIFPLSGKLLEESLNPWRNLRDEKYQCFYSLCSEENVTKLKRVYLTSDEDALHSIALHYKRLYSLGLTSSENPDYFFKKALKSSPPSPELIINYGNFKNVLAIKNCIKKGGDDEGGIPAVVPNPQLQKEALDLYDQALQIKENHLLAILNKSFLLSLLNNNEESLKILHSAIDIYGNKSVEDYQKSFKSVESTKICANPLIGNQITIDALPSVWKILRLDLQDFAIGELIPMEGFLLGSLSVKNLPIMCLITIFIMVFFILFGKKFKLPKFCLFCGEISCPDCNRELTGFNYCSNCILTQIKGGFIDPMELWQKHRDKEKKVKSKLLFGKFFSFLLPGAGQFFRGFVFTGISLMVIFLSCIFLLLFPRGIIDDPVNIRAGIPLINILVPSSVALITYIVSIIHIFLKKG